MVDREKGQEGTSSCPRCGTTLALEAQDDGGVAAETCPSCFGPAQAEKAEKTSKPVVAGHPAKPVVTEKSEDDVVPETAAAGGLSRETGTAINTEEI